MPNAVQAFLKTTGHDHRSRDGGDGSRGRIRRRQPLHVPAVAGRRHGAADSVRRQDVARRLHPGRRSERHQRRLAQQRQVRDVPHDVAAWAGQGPESDQAGREPESGEDAAHALRRVEEDAACAECGTAESAAARSRAARRRRQLPESPRTDPDDDADDNGVDRWRNDSGEIHAGRRLGVAAALVEQRAGWARRTSC